MQGRPVTTETASTGTNATQIVRFPRAATPCASDDNDCTDDACDGVGSCGHGFNSNPCDDSNPCTHTDECRDGACSGLETRRATCTTSPKARLLMQRGGTPGADKFEFKWKKGPPMTLAEIGDPISSQAYSLCVYDADGLAFQARIPETPLCSGEACWKALSTVGYKYTDGTRSIDGITVATVVSGESNARASMKGKGAAIPDLPMPLNPPVTAQMIGEGIPYCVEGEFPSDNIGRNDVDKFSARVP